MSEPVQLGRYALYAQLASGGMATVYLARLNGEAGFGRTVAIKRLHPHLAREGEFVRMFLDEAHLAARIQHPNVVPTLDIVTSEDEIFLVMEYVPGESLAGILRAADDAEVHVPVPVSAQVAIGLLSGLHAAHEARDEQGAPLSIVHRDVSPQNVLVGVDGVARLLDFGVARAATRLSGTREGQLKGKVAYMAPEQLRGQVTQVSDVYAAGVVFWEALTCRRLFTADSEGELVRKVMDAGVKPPSRFNPEVSKELDGIVLRAVAKDPSQRWSSAHEMAEAIDSAIRPASAMKVAECVQLLVGPALQKRAALVASAESNSEPKRSIAFARTTDGLPRLDARTSTPDVARHAGVSEDSTYETSTLANALTREARSVRPRGLSATQIGIGLAGVAMLGSALTFALMPARAPATALGAEVGGAVSAVPPQPSAAPSPTIVIVQAPPPSQPSTVAPTPAPSMKPVPTSAVTGSPVTPAGTRTRRSRPRNTTPAPGNDLDDLLDTR